MFQADLIMIDFYIPFNQFYQSNSFEKIMIKFPPRAKFLLIPFAYLMLVKNLNKYYLNNDLRFLHKHDILVPWLKRIDDHQSSDPRDISQSLRENTQANLGKSVVHQQQMLVDNQGHSVENMDDAQRESNLNLIKRENL